MAIQVPSPSPGLTHCPRSCLKHWFRMPLRFFGVPAFPLSHARSGQPVACRFTDSVGTLMPITGHNLARRYAYGVMQVGAVWSGKASTRTASSLTIWLLRAQICFTNGSHSPGRLGWAAFLHCAIPSLSLILQVVWQRHWDYRFIACLNLKTAVDRFISAGDACVH